MPLLASTYRAPFGFANGHLQSILPAAFRRVEIVTPQRERIATSDGDFLDLDRTPHMSSRVAVLSHGLEGSSRRGYIQGMARALHRRGWDVVAWNYRGCSGELNRALRFYHSGATEDLRVVLQHVLARGDYQRVALVGFSLGGNLTLKYLGEESDGVDPRIIGAATFSVPCDLTSSSVRLAAWSNRIYMRRFLRTLKRKVAAKAALFPGQLDLRGLAAMRTFAEFDGRFTAPLHGFASAADYWQRASSRPWLKKIRVPALLVNARDDPFLGAGCFPVADAEQSEFVFLEMPASGGHVGFLTFDRSGEYWSEARAGAFLEGMWLDGSGGAHASRVRTSASSPTSCRVRVSGETPDTAGETPALPGNGTTALHRGESHRRADGFWERACSPRGIPRLVGVMSYAPAENRYDTMTYNRCGRSGLKLPALSLGLWHNFGGTSPLENQRAMCRRAFDLGITHFDLANNYGPPAGSAESNFGEILRSDFAGRRDELIISTKAGYWMWNGPYGEWGSRKYLTASLDQSLRRMGLDYVDIFYSHRFDPDTPLEETMGALDQALRAGKALYVGISSYNSRRTHEANALLREFGQRCLIHQPSYSMLNRWVETDGLLDTLAVEGIGCIAFSPLAQGMLTDKYLAGRPADSRVQAHSSLSEKFLSAENLANIRALDAIARARGQTLAQMAIAWVLRKPQVTSALIGASKVTQIEDCVAALQNTRFTAEELAQIDRHAKDGDINLWAASSAG